MLSIPEFKDAERVFYYFEEISKIPHGSSNCKKIADYLVEFAKAHGLPYYRDDAENVIIRKSATQGYEGRPTVIIQGHTDMVAEKLPELSKNMEDEGLEIYRDGDFLRAKGTTLGGDDGIAVAYALALLESDDIPHPAIEALFTSDEEIGLLGATALDASQISGKIMINVDSDDEGIFTVGCAGGVRIDMGFDVTEAQAIGKKYKLTVSGLLGGHSGVEIDKGRANAIKLGASVLSFINDVRIASIFGGNADNAIPRDFSAEFVADGDVFETVNRASASVFALYEDADPDIKITVEESEFDTPTLDAESSLRIINTLNKIPSGVISMSKEIEGLVESSMNLGIVRLEEGVARFTVSVRSAKGDKKESLKEFLMSIAKEAGATYSERGEYPAWEYKPHSHIRDVACKVFSEMYKRDAEVITIHAGLECGIFSNKIEGLDCISLGPDNFDIHTTEEHLSIPSSARVWEFLKKVLKEI